jgi:hypothetical protein
MRNIWIFIKWLLYVLLTQDERLNYLYGKNKGMQVIKRERGFNLCDGNYMDVWFDPNKKPEREYLTFKEFFKIHNPIENEKNTRSEFKS